MKSFSERNTLLIGAVGIVLVAAIALMALEYKRLPFVNSGEQYSAYFAEAGGLNTSSAVQVSGLRVGQVTDIELDGPRVRITFTVNKNVRLGRTTEAAVKTKSLLGAKVLEVTPRGDGTLTEPIPLEHTTSAYQLPDALGDLATTIHGLRTDQLNESLATLSDTFKDTAPDLRAAVAGTAKFSQTLDQRDKQLRGLLENANKATSVLAQRSDEVVGLIKNTQALLAELGTQRAALEHIAGNISALSREVTGLVAENRATLKPALDKINGVLTIIDNRKERIQKSIKLLNSYAMSLGESVASGPYFKAILVNLLPGQFIQPFVDAAFSDLGLDPNVLLPSQRIDPPTGQPATPPLPVPYPRTGQGGDPNINLPDAITGKPGDPRYPYREPLPAPPPGGPPPGPPAAAPPGLASTPALTPSPIYVPAPGEVPPPQPHGQG
ncbi:Mce family protein Mce3C [Mycobacterium saskatchewanense]|uniref:Mammalian cell entry protein n=1 Tax=Mycobacterium saskatchewanense TaxID=220927 RepID=A0AAJ3NR58_9MYCO|nr:MCE family protein [Mycobacterium saskatchewanense]ORW72906.1 mammalian cell entry protein [Mycobacterium saskatchewanense]BBX62567.1 Mce family protein Mce3C [Mycobacterium saskatchewanense]